MNAPVLVAARMLGEILSRWDPPALKERILESQRRRRFIQRVLLEGERSPWDCRPVSDPSRQYVRSSINTSTTLTRGVGPLPVHGAGGAGLSAAGSRRLARSGFVRGPLTATNPPTARPCADAVIRAP